MGQHMDFDAWVDYGVKQGWASRPVCSTHGGIPYTTTESTEWEEGNDPCAHVIRLFETPEDQKDALGDMNPS